MSFSEITSASPPGGIPENMASAGERGNHVGASISLSTTFKSFAGATVLLEAVEFPVLVLDGRGQVRFLNQALSSVLGVGKDAVIGVDWNNSYGLAGDRIDDVPAIPAMLNGAAKPTAFRQRVKAAHGDALNILWQPTILRNDTNSVDGLLLCGDHTPAVTVTETSTQSPVNALNGRIKTLSDRIRELTCLIEIGKLKEQRDLTIPGFLQRCVELLPFMWADPEQTKARITLDTRSYASGDYSNATLCFNSDLVIDGITRGTVEVAHLLAGSDDCAVLDEGQLLVDTVTQEVADYLGRRLATEELHQQKLLLDNIITNIPQHVFWKDRESVYLGCNANFAKAAGVEKPADLIGKTDYDLAWSREESDFYRSCDKQVMDDGRPLINIDESQTRADGKEVRLLTSKVPLRDSRGEVVGLLGMYADVTELRATQDALSKINDMLAALIEASPVAIVMFDTDAKVTVWNPAAERTFGWQAFEVIGQTPPYIPEGSEQEHDAIWKAVTGGESIQNKNVKRKRKDGAVLDVDLSAAPVQGNNNEIMGAISILQDVTAYEEAARALARSETRYRSIYEALTDVYFETDIDGTILEMSPSCIHIFGFTPEQLIGQPSTGRYRDPESRGNLLEALNTREEVKDFELTLVRADGVDIPVSVNARLVRDDQGNPVKLQGIIHDITSRRQAEQKIKDTMAQLNATLNALPDILFEVDAEGRIHSFHTHNKDALFVAPEQFLGRKIREVMPPEAAETIMNAINRALTDGAVRGVAYSLPSPSGERWYEMSMTTKGDATGPDPRFIAVTRDITDRRKAQDELALTTSRYTTMINTVPAVMYVKNVNQEYITGNLELSRLAGRPIEQIIGCTTESIFADEFGRRLSEADQAAAASGKELTVAEERMTFPDGEERWVSTTRVPLLDHQGQVTGLVGLLQDVTNQRRSREQLVQADKLAAIGTLAAGVAHEINNPIGFISSNLNTMAKYLQKIQLIVTKPAGVGEDDRETLDAMLTDFADAVAESLEGTTRVRNIVADLKSFSRVDRAEKELANLNEGINSTLNIVWNELKYKCKVEKDLGDIPDIFCIPNQLNQVFMNILINASHAIKHDQGLIKVRTWTDDDNVYVSFEDNGEGIPPANLKKIFEPFFTTKDVGKGTGLGLSLAYDIVKKHHGSIDIWSEVGVGTRFTIVLPKVGLNE